MASANILVIDEDEHILDLFRNIFNEFNTPVETAKECSSGVSKLADRKFELVFLDANLGRITGYEILKLIKGLHKDTKVIIMSAHIEKIVIESHAEVHADAYLEKPLSLIDILSYTNRYVDIPGLSKKLAQKQNSNHS